MKVKRIVTISFFFLFLISVAVFVSFSPQIRTALSSSDAVAVEWKTELKEGMCVKPGR